MKKRIFLFQTTTLLVALAALLLVSAIVIRGVMEAYQNSVGTVDEQITEVQEVLSDWSDFNWYALDQELEKNHCNLLVSYNYRVVYSSLDSFQQEQYLRLAPYSLWPENGILAIQDQGVLMIGRRIGPLDLVAVGEPVTPYVFGEQRFQEDAVALALLVSGVLAIVVIVVLSLLFTRYQVKLIMRPVQQLADAARRIEAGDLTTPIAYTGKDEFAAVCTAFDAMQSHLLAEKEKNAAYEKARTDLVAGISHDLRTPLTSVKGYIKGLRDGVANTPEKQQRYLEIASRKADDMERLLERLFTYSKLATGNLPIYPTEQELGAFAQRFARDATEELSSLGGAVEVYRQHQSIPVNMDREQMMRVLINLKENAIRYAGVSPLHLTLTAGRQGDRAYLKFADNGNGVPEEQLPHLFEQFWRGDEARSIRNGEGSGLGLYIVQVIVEAHGGTITAENDGGLVFTITLPIKEEEHGTYTDRRG